MRTRRLAVLAAAAVLAVMAVLAVGKTAPAWAALQKAADWQMDETSGQMVDSSGNGNNGNPTGVVQTGSAYVFDGSTSRVAVPDNGTLDPAGKDVTLTASVAVPDGAMDDDSYDVVRKGLSTTAGGDYKMEIKRASDPTVGYLHCLFKGDVGTVNRVAPVDVVDGGRHTLECAKTGNSVVARVDGTSYAKTGTVGSIVNDKETLIGAKTTDPFDDVFEGSMDLVSIDIDAAATEPPADATAPAVQPPEQDLVTGATLGTSAVPVKLKWSATDAADGISKYELQQSVNDGAYAGVKLATATATSKAVSLTPGSAYQYRVRATDGAGNTSGWSDGPRFAVDASQESSAAISYGGAWTPQAVTSAYGGALQYATAAGASAAFGFTGRDVAWVAPRGPDRGKAEVWVDGARVKTVDLYASAAQPRKVVFTQSWVEPGGHTLEVRVLGAKRSSSSGTRADADAFVALR